MNKHQSKNIDCFQNKKNSQYNANQEELQSKIQNSNSFEKSHNMINNDSKTILSEENSEFIDNNNKNFNKNYKNIYTTNTNNNYNKIKQKTIETVLENEGEENCSYNQNSENGYIDNDPIVTFIFYKEENIFNENERKNSEKADNNHNNSNLDIHDTEKNYINNHKKESKPNLNKNKNDNNNNNNNKNDFYNTDNNNEDKSLSLNLNNIKQHIGNNNNNNSNNQNLFNINDLIDDISQSEIFANLNGKKDENIFSVENFNINNNEENNTNNVKKNNLYKENNHEKSEDNQSVKFNILFSQIIEACPIIQLSADTSKVK